MTDSSVIVDGSTGQIACNSYELYQRDIEMLQSLNVNLAKIFKFLQLLEKTTIIPLGNTLQVLDRLDEDFAKWNWINQSTRHRLLSTFDRWPSCCQNRAHGL